jgi:heme exporter protein C
MKHWWKILSLLLIGFSYVAGFMITVPDLPVIHDSIRNLFFHVPMWFSMIFLMLISLINSFKYLSTSKMKYDAYAIEAVNTALFFGFLGIITGMIWAHFAWGRWWISDPKLNGAALSMLSYMAYIILRKSIQDEMKRARVSAVYNIFAFLFMILFMLIIPRLNYGSLHPGNGGNPVLGGENLDPLMRVVFYPAVLGWILFAFWMVRIKVKNSGK